MTHNFDELVVRRGSDSAKWQFYGEDVLPMWVADMDFRSPQPILDAMKERIDHGVFGYGRPAPELREALCQRMKDRYDWAVQPEEILLVPGLVSGLNVMCRATGESGDGVLINTPVYPPFIMSPPLQDRVVQDALLDKTLVGENGSTHLRYEINWAAFEAAITDRTRLFILCNPHNPTGRAYTRDELTKMADICARNDIIICSDEIHSDLLMGDTQHLPIATLSPDVAARTITLIAPSKTFNVPGLGCSAIIVQDEELRKKVEKAEMGIVPHVNILGYTAALAAYTECGEWLEELLVYLTANRDYMVDFVGKNMPNIRTTVPEATYLAWLDCTESAIEGNPQEFFLERAKVGLNDGTRFGKGGEGFVRLNFGCPRATLEEGLEKMAEALSSL